MYVLWHSSPREGSSPQRVRVTFWVICSSFSMDCEGQGVWSIEQISGQLCTYSAVMTTRRKVLKSGLNVDVWIYNLVHVIPCIGLEPKQTPPPLSALAGCD